MLIVGESAFAGEEEEEEGERQGKVVREEPESELGLCLVAGAKGRSSVLADRVDEASLAAASPHKPLLFPARSPLQEGLPSPNWGRFCKPCFLAGALPKGGRRRTM